MLRSVSSADADRSRLRSSRARRLTGMSTNPSRCETLWWSLSGCRSRSEPTGWSETKKATAAFKSTRSKRNSVFRGADARTLRVHQHPAPHQYRHGGGLALEAHPTPEWWFHRYRSQRPSATGRPVPISRRAACSRTSGVYFLRLPDIRTCFLAGPAVPPVRCSTIMGQPQVT